MLKSTKQACPKKFDVSYPNSLGTPDIELLDGVFRCQTFYGMVKDEMLKHFPDVEFWVFDEMEIDEVRLIHSDDKRVMIAIRRIA